MFMKKRSTRLLGLLLALIMVLSLFPPISIARPDEVECEYEYDVYDVVETEEARADDGGDRALSPGMSIVSAEVAFRPDTVGPAVARQGLSQEQVQFMLANYRGTRLANPTHGSVDQFMVGQGDMYEQDGTVYTFLREASLSECRIFNIQAVIPYIANFDPADLELWYGLGTGRTVGNRNRPLGNVTGAWSGAAYPQFNYGSTAVISEILDVSYEVVGGNIVVDLRVQFFNMQPQTGNMDSLGAGFGGNQARVNLFDDLRLGANRTRLSPGDSAALNGAHMRLYYGTTADALATMPFTVRYRDYQMSWRELEYHLLQPGVTANRAVNEVIWSDGQVEIGDGSFSFGDRFVRVESLGRTMGLQTGAAAAGFPALPDGPEEIWVGMVSDSRASMERYINEIVPLLNTDPTAVRELFGDDMRLAVVYTNNHSGEQPGPDAVFHLFNLIAQSEYIEYTSAVEVRNQGPFLCPFYYPMNTQNPTSRSNLGSRWTGGMFNDHFQLEHYGQVGPANARRPLFDSVEHYLSFWNVMNQAAGTEEIALNVDAMLEEYIFIFFFTQNPDGRQQGGIRGMTYGMDPNRDSLFQTMPESVYGKGFLAAWEPVYLLEYHILGFPFMIDPCTAPHDPNLEYDIQAPRSHRVTREMTRALTGMGVHPRVLVNAENIDRGIGFDDASPVYSPGFSAHFGGLGHTIEGEGQGARHVLGMMTAAFGTMRDLHERADDFLGFKIEYRRRGVENENTDALVNAFMFAASPNRNIDWRLPLATWGEYETTPPWTWADEGDPWGADGRRIHVRDARDSIMIPRAFTDTIGFHPQYYIIPMNSEDQLDVSQAQHMLEKLTRFQVRVERLTEDTVVAGTLYRAGALIVDMRQGNRDIANTALNPAGLDFSPAPARMYAETSHSFGALRGFTVERIDVPNAFEGRTEAVNYNIITVRGVPAKQVVHWDDIPNLAISSLTGTGDTVIVTNNSLDALRAVFYALRNDEPVRMVTSFVPGLAVRGDFVMSRTLFESLRENFYMEGHAVASLDEALSQPLVRPVIQINGAQGDNRWAFENLGLVLGEDFFFGANANRNVVINANINTNPVPLLEQGIGFINVGVQGHVVAGNAMGPGYTFGTIPAGGVSGTAGVEALLRAEYNTHSTITANMELAQYVFTQFGINHAGISTLPAGAIPLVTALNDDHIPEAERYLNAFDERSFFRAGWMHTPDAEDRPVTERRKGVFANQTFVAAGTFNGDPEGAQIVTFVTNMFLRGHNHFFSQRMLGNAILAVAADVQVINREPLSLEITNAPAVLRRNTSVALGATIVPAAAAQDVIWSSNNPAVATVNAQGVVTARVATGVAVITARTPDGQLVSSVTIRLSM